MPAPKSRYTLTFEDPQLEANYWAAFFDRHEAYARAVYLFSMVILVAYGLYERVLFPDRYQLFWFIRYVFVVPMALTAAPLLWWRPLRTFTRRRLQEVVTACVTAVLLGLAVITYVTLDVRENFEILYFGLGFSITAIFPYLVLRLRFIFASFLGWSITFGATVVVLSNGGFSLGFTAVFVQMVTINLLGMIGAYLLESYDRDNYVAQQELADARGRAEALLLNVLPEPIAERLKSGEQPIADHFEDVAVVFTDIAGFTPMSAELPPPRSCSCSTRCSRPSTAWRTRRASRRSRRSAMRTWSPPASPPRERTPSTPRHGSRSACVAGSASATAAPCVSASASTWVRSSPG
jgi:hypothetical protein